MEEIEDINQFFKELADEGDLTKKEYDADDWDLRLRRLNRKVAMLKHMREQAAEAIKTIDQQRDLLIKEIAKRMGLHDDKRFRDFINADDWDGTEGD